MDYNNSFQANTFIKSVNEQKCFHLMPKRKQFKHQVSLKGKSFPKQGGTTKTACVSDSHPPCL